MFIPLAHLYSLHSKPLEITFEVNHEKFNEIYNIFFSKNNKNENENSKSKNKNKIKNIYNFDLINIGNLKSMSNIISVLKIIKSADKYRKSSDKPNKIESHNIINSKNNKEENSKENLTKKSKYAKKISSINAQKELKYGFL